jgi:hypothetical protein
VIIFERYDDLDYHNGKRKTYATQFDVPISWKGESRVLDLSQENYDRLNEIISELITAGRKPEKPAERKPQTTAKGYKSKAHGRRPDVYYEGLRKFADEREITKRDGSGRPAYSAPEGSNRDFDYPIWLIRMYDEHLAASGQRAA